MAGWDVVAMLADPDTAVPLRILGVAVFDLEGPLSAPMHHVWPDAVIVAPPLFGDARVRDGVRECLDRRAVTVLSWGEDLPADLAPRFRPYPYRLSMAARAFKARALAAADLPSSAVAATEALQIGRSAEGPVLDRAGSGGVCGGSGSR